MQNQICYLSIVPSDFDAFEELIQKTVAATREEPDTTILDSTARTAASTEPLIPHEPEDPSNENRLRRARRSQGTTPTNAGRDFIAIENPENIYSVSQKFVLRLYI